MRSMVRLAILAVLALGARASDALAVTVAPMQIEMVSTGGRSHATVSVVNNSDQPLPIEVVASRMSMDESGNPKMSKASDEFLLMPPQAMIPPRATQNFRIQWLGEPVLQSSQSFYIFFNQVPLKSPPGKAAVQVVMSMGVMVNVAPPHGRADLRVVGTGIATDAHGKRHPMIIVQNHSNVHGLLPQGTVHLAAGNWTETLPPGLLSETIGSGLVQPGKRRKFVLPVDVPQGVTSVRASLEMSARR